MTDLTDLESGGCCDYSVSRRSLLRLAGAGAALGAVTQVFGGAVTQTVYGDASSGSNVLILLSLRGGADGLSMVVPHAEQAYYAGRPQSAVARGSLIHADATFGLHPMFSALTPMWQSGQFAAIQAVGLPTPNRSHFEAMELIEDADPTSPERVGWLNRMIASIGTSDSFEGLHLGGDAPPTNLFGPAPKLASTSLATLDLPRASDARLRSGVRRGLDRMYQDPSSRLRGPGRTALDIADRARASARSTGVRNGAQYAGGDLASALQEAATAIRSGLGVRAISIDFGSWDHHESLLARISPMIEALAKNLAAFFTDLGDQADRVTVVTLSEFGRRLSQNGSAGLDHGYGNCVLALGAGVRGGQYYGRWPTLGSGKQVDGDLAVTTDFRAVMAEILDNRFPDVSLSSVFPGLVYGGTDALGFIR